MQVVARPIHNQAWAFMCLASFMYKGVKAYLVAPSNAWCRRFLVKYTVNEQVAKCLRHIDVVLMICAKISIYHLSHPIKSNNKCHKRKKKTKTFGLVTDHWLSQGSSLRSQPWPTKRPTAMAVVGAVHYDDVAMSGWGMEMGASPDPSQGGGRPW